MRAFLEFHDFAKHSVQDCLGILFPTIPKLQLLYLLRDSEHIPALLYEVLQVIIGALVSHLSQSHSV